MAIKLKVEEPPKTTLNASGSDAVTVTFGTRDYIEVVESGDYEDLTNKPSINGVELIGDKTAEDLGIEADNIFVAEYGVTTYAEVLAAYQADKVLLAKRGASYYVLGSYSSGRNFEFYSTRFTQADRIGVGASGWSTGSFTLVPVDRKINGKGLGSNITLTASDVGAVSLDGDENISGEKNFTTPPVLSSVYEGQYAELDYISGNGSAYLDTGLPIHMGWRYLIDFQQSDTGQYRIWGVFNQQSYSGGVNLSLTYSTGWTFRWETTSGQTREAKLNTSIDANRHVAVINSGTASMDGYRKDTSQAQNNSVVSNYNGYLFTINPGGTTPTTTMKGKIYAYKVWDGSGNLMQDFVPVRDMTTDAVGMYDRVNRVFHGAKAGTFTAGNVVSGTSQLVDIRMLPKVAITGMYDDLIGKP